MREMLEDPDFELEFNNGKKLKYPAKVIAKTMMLKASAGDVGAAKWLRETGYGNKIEITDLPVNKIKFVNEVPNQPVPDDKQDT